MRNKLGLLWICYFVFRLQAVPLRPVEWLDGQHIVTWCSDYTRVVDLWSDIPLPVGSRIVPGLSYQLVTAIAHNDWTASVLELTNSPTISPLTEWHLTCPAHKISARTAYKTQILCRSVNATVETCLFEEPLYSNGSFIVIYSAVVA
jgi:hypothetical protein